MISLTTKDWNDYSSKQKEILVKLGFKPKGKVRTPKLKRGLPTLKEYDLLLYTECRLCKQERWQAFRMTPTNYNNGKEPHLQGIKIKIAHLKNNHKKTAEVLSSCQACADNLMEKSKKELVEIILNRNRLDNLWKKERR